MYSLFRENAEGALTSLSPAEGGLARPPLGRVVAEPRHSGGDAPQAAPRQSPRHSRGVFGHSPGIVVSRYKSVWFVLETAMYVCRMSSFIRLICWFDVWGGL